MVSLVVITVTILISNWILTKKDITLPFTVKKKAVRQNLKVNVSKEKKDCALQIDIEN